VEVSAIPAPFLRKDLSLVAPAGRYQEIWAGCGGGNQHWGHVDGLRDLVDAFKQKGQGEVADSWVSRGPNKQIAPHQLEQTIGPDVLETLSQQTGLSREELLSRLSKNLPDAVDKYTPEGRIPTAAEFSRS
jgi:uncharacterized protein YidB (DUF937 family)